MRFLCARNVPAIELDGLVGDRQHEAVSAAVRRHDRTRMQRMHDPYAGRIVEFPLAR